MTQQTPLWYMMNMQVVAVTAALSPDTLSDSELSHFETVEKGDL